MKKSYLSAIILFLIMFLVTGCGNRSNSTANDMKDTKELDTMFSIGPDIFLKDYQELLNIKEFIGELDEEPNWSMTNFGSIEAFHNFCSTMSIPKAITDIYDEHNANEALNENGEVEFWGINENLNYLIVDPDFKVKKVEELYYITISYKEADIMYQGFFRNGDSLVIISVIEYSETLEYLPERIKMFCRTEISNEGQVDTEYENLDTALLDKRGFKTVMECPEFTLVYYTEINEFLCVKDSKAIGPSTDVELIDLEDIHPKESGGLGVINNFGALDEEKTLIYPAIVENDEGTSFKLLCSTDVEDFESQIGIPLWANIKGSNVSYPVVNEKVVYYVDGATQTDYEVAYMNYLEWLTPTNPIFVNSSESIIRHYDIYYNSLQCELQDASKEGYVQIFMYNDDIQLTGEIPSPINCIKNAIEDGKFSQYISEKGEYYEIPTYVDMQKVLKDLGISVE